MDSNSALLQLSDSHEEKSYVNADHSTMVKFGNMQDRTYKDVRYKLRSFLDIAPAVVRKRFHPPLPPFSQPLMYPYGTFPDDVGRVTEEGDTQTTEPPERRMIENNSATQGI